MLSIKNGNMEVISIPPLYDSCTRLLEIFKTAELSKYETITNLQNASNTV